MRKYCETYVGKKEIYGDRFTPKKKIFVSGIFHFSIHVKMMSLYSQYFVLYRSIP